MIRYFFRRLAGVGLVTTLVARAAFGTESPPRVELPGLRPDGSVLLPNQWSLRPVGKQVPLGDFPVNIAVHPDGKFAAVMHSGHGANEIIVVNLASAREVSRVKVREAFYGLAFSHGGNRLYCSGSSDEVIHVFDFKEGALTANEDIPLCDPKERGFPCGLAVSADSRHLYAANVWGQCVTELDLSTRRKIVDFTPVPGLEQVVERKVEIELLNPIDPDLHAVTKREVIDTTAPDAPFPYACVLDEERQLLYVSLWAKSAVAMVDTRSNRILKILPTQEHPSEMVLARQGRYLLVANANRNTVTVLDTIKGKILETLYASFSPSALPGSTPSSLALSPDEYTLYVANACNNNIAVFDVAIMGKSRSRGFIPVGWYPTSVRVTPDGRHLLVANGKGLISRANPKGPAPGKKRTAETQSIDELFPGTLSIIDLPANRGEYRRQLAAWTEQAHLCTPAETVAQVTPAANNPVPGKGGKPSPITHCVYIIKENRTYDQIMGDMKEGNGDAKLCLFPENITPNHHKLAREFVLLDNFYADAEVSADGHEWSMGAYATDFVEKMWPFNYRHAKKFPFPSEGRFPIAEPAGGYLWDRAAEAGVSYRSYGEFVFNDRKVDGPCWARLTALKGHFDKWYRGFDVDYPDFKRAQRFLVELKEFESKGEMPRLMIIRLPNDHTSGGVAGKPTPVAYVADNDRSLGMIVEALSRSQFWPHTAIFILEDDAQNGPDHVDAHRIPAFVVSPYTRHATVDSTMYSTSSLLHTIELILGLKSMSQFDAAATPMYHAFQAAPDVRPYEAVSAQVDYDAKNPGVGKNSEASLHLDFSKEDLVDDQVLNEIIWHSVRGENSIMPPPTRAAFVMELPKPDKD